MTLTLTVAGVVPLEMLTDNHAAFEEIVNGNGVLVLPRFSVCAVGADVPS